METTLLGRSTAGSVFTRRGVVASMDRALVIGGTRFIGRHAVAELLEHGYEVTLFNRGNRENPFADDERVAHVAGDRTDEDALADAAASVDPDVVLDMVAYHPGEVETATRIFADAGAYVYVSSGAVYADDEIPKREGETRLQDCSDAQAKDDSGATYGPRKAEGDRAIFASAERGANATSVRPTVVYGPYDYTERVDYWIDRVDSFDRVVVPGDGTFVWHLAYVADVAAALRVVAERGQAGEAYNVADRNAATLGRFVESIADALDADVDIVHAGGRELSVAGLDGSDFPLYGAYPHLLSVEKLAALGWESTPLPEALDRTVAEHRESDRDGRDQGPSREAESRVLDVLDTI
jgi:nucleoside-diphosphate-sugar epimerase